MEQTEAWESPRLPTRPESDIGKSNALPKASI